MASKLDWQHSDRLRFFFYGFMRWSFPIDWYNYGTNWHTVTFKLKKKKIAIFLLKLCFFFIRQWSCSTHLAFSHRLLWRSFIHQFWFISEYVWSLSRWRRSFSNQNKPIIYLVHRTQTHNFVNHKKPETTIYSMMNPTAFLYLLPNDVTINQTIFFRFGSRSNIVILKKRKHNNQKKKYLMWLRSKKVIKLFLMCELCNSWWQPLILRRWKKAFTRWAIFDPIHKFFFQRRPKQRKEER